MRKMFIFLMGVGVLLAGLNVAIGQEATYQGVAVCQGCHSGPPGGNIYPFWIGTRHAVAYDSASAVVQNTADCLQCHTTGWDTTKANLGADDFVTINSDGSITIDNETEFKKKVNVQCESCHGPASLHTAGAFQQPPVLPPMDPADAATCGLCHEGEHHPYIEEWSVSAHAISNTNASPFLQNSFRNDPNCSGCHTFQGFMQFVGTTSADTTNMIPNIANPPGDESKPLVCAACHDPHDAKNEGQLRLEVASLCVKCHNPEDAQPGEDVHHSTSEMWNGVGAVEFPGFTYRHLSPHQLVEPAASRKCVTCHVFMSPFEAGPPVVPAATGHTFQPRLEACGQSGCHIGGLTTFNYKNRQTYTDSLADVLEDILANVSPADSATQAFADGLFNLQFEVNARSSGVHNPYYAEDILVNTIDYLRGVFTSVEPTPDAQAGVPRAFDLHQNYPNPFNPSTKIRFDVPRTSHVQIVIYNSLGQEIETLVDKELPPNSYEVEFNGDRLSSGLYFYKLISDGFVTTKKMLLLK